jgi:hypothetical protein
MHCGRYQGNTGAELDGALEQKLRMHCGRYQGNTGAELDGALEQKFRMHCGRSQGNTGAEVERSTKAEVESALEERMREHSLKTTKQIVRGYWLGRALRDVEKRWKRVQGSIVGENKAIRI